MIAHRVGLSLPVSRRSGAYAAIKILCDDAEKTLSEGQHYLIEIRRNAGGQWIVEWYRNE